MGFPLLDPDDNVLGNIAVVDTKPMPESYCKLRMEANSAVYGVNFDELFGTIDAVKKAPVITKFKFRAENQWIDGGHNRTTLKNF